eukprot:CAMPEP_0171118724 /NCGR_PEP_ID=MMETSP0766_2-20121228/95401_1 /TAXON_ID=439317 /ORGANISM="Gambierdiscus australes, Strain CAWD 149" /LENGTH=436 /DNA_ID=CAMNT_0011581329 /DNA_START=1 /DNA_END=1312 /DNA_ORIENTATION=-
MPCVLAAALVPGTRRSAHSRGGLCASGRISSRAAAACPASRGVWAAARGVRRRMAKCLVRGAGQSLPALRAVATASSLPTTAAVAATLPVSPALRPRLTAAADVVPASPQMLSRAAPPADVRAPVAEALLALRPALASSAAAVVGAASVADARPVSPVSRRSGAELPATLQPMPVTFRAGSTATGCRHQLLCYGDSLTAGFYAGGRAFEPYAQTLAEVLAAAGSATEIRACGHSGHSAGEMVKNLESNHVQDVAMRHGKGLRRILADEPLPELVLIMAGTNDLGRQRTSKAIFQDVHRLHSECHARGVRTVVLAPPAAPSMARTSWERERGKVKELLAAWARSAPLCALFVDPAELVQPTRTGGAWDPDGLHFSAAGSQLLGRRLAPLLLPLLVARRSPGAGATAVESTGQPGAAEPVPRRDAGGAEVAYAVAGCS